MKETILKKLRENFVQEAGEQDAASKPEGSSQEKPEASANPQGGKALYAAVHQALQNPMINHAEIIRQLWNDSDNASARSLFRKKLEQEKMSDGDGHYQFSMDELIKIRNIINKAGKTMSVSAN